MRRTILLLSVFFFCFCAVARNLETVILSDYGSLSIDSIKVTLVKAINDIEGKRLIFPSLALDVDDIILKDKSNFEIVGDTSYAITCRNFLIEDCTSFELKGLFVKGTKEKFATFYIKGDCYKFRVHDCLFDSEKGTDGHYTFYGIHIITDTKKSNYGYHNSPRDFRVYNNVVRHTKYDGILTHAYCSDFVIERNVIIGSECIGIEVEGRLGGLKSTTVHPCKKAIIRKNEMRDCGDWGVLLMWTDKVKVYKNNCVNSYGSFLSIGCTNLTVKKNVFEGRNKGFEISQEYYKVENGINDNVKIINNVIKGRARENNRGVLDIRHAKNIVVKKNRITALYRDKSAYVSLASCRQVTIKKNEFSFENEPLKDLIYKTNVQSPETNRDVPELNLDDLSIQEIIIKKK